MWAREWVAVHGWCQDMFVFSLVILLQADRRYRRRAPDIDWEQWMADQMQVGLRKFTPPQHVNVATAPLQELSSGLSAAKMKTFFPTMRAVMFKKPTRTKSRGAAGAPGSSIAGAAQHGAAASAPGSAPDHACSCCEPPTPLRVGTPMASCPGRTDEDAPDIEPPLCRSSARRIGVLSDG